MPRLVNWKFVSAMKGFKDPVIDNSDEINSTRLFGMVYDDPRANVRAAIGLDGNLTSEFADGHRIVTSPIHELDFKKRQAKTRSGTLYELLGPPDEDWVAWLKENNKWETYKDLLSSDLN